MVTRSTRTLYSKRKVAAARKAVNRASSILRGRSARSMAPLSTRGFWGNYSSTRRGARPELKFVDTLTNGTVNGTSYTLLLLNGVAQGTDFNQRIGRQLKMKSILFRGNAYPVSTASANAPQGILLRLVLIYDSQPNSGTLPVGTDIFTTQDPLAPMNLNNRDRFKVIYDSIKQIGSYSINASSVIASGAPQNVIWQTYKKCNLETAFSGTGATLGSISTGAVYLAFGADISALCDVNFMCRIRFYDS